MTQMNDEHGQSRLLKTADTCYAAANRGEPRCVTYAECVWGCALWNHWDR